MANIEQSELRVCLDVRITKNSPRSACRGMEKRVNKERFCCFPKLILWCLGIFILNIFFEFFRSVYQANLFHSRTIFKKSSVLYTMNSKNDRNFRVSDSSRAISNTESNAVDCLKKMMKLQKFSYASPSVTLKISQSTSIFNAHWCSQKAEKNYVRLYRIFVSWFLSNVQSLESNKMKVFLPTLNPMPLALFCMMYLNHFQFYITEKNGF